MTSGSQRESGNGKPGNGRPPIPSTDPVVRFLGPGAMRSGPFGVLGLPVRDVGETEVLGAVHAAMERIEGHPESRTPAADEARLAVHAAAANLLDTAVRDELLRRLGVSAKATPAASGSGAQLSRGVAKPGGVGALSRGQASVYALEADVLRCIAGSGGWNKRAMRHFMKIAHMKGHTTSQAMGAIRSLWRGGEARSMSSRPPAVVGGVAAPGAPGAPGASADLRRPFDSGVATTPKHKTGPDPEPASGVSVVWAAISIFVVVVVLIVGGWLVWNILHTPAGQEQTTRQTPAPAPAPAPGGPAVAEESRQDQHDDQQGTPHPSAGRILDNGPAIVHELEIAGEGLSLDIEGSLSTFEFAVAALAQRWGEIPPADRLAAHDRIVGFFYRVGGQRLLADRTMLAVEGGASALLSGEIAGPGDVWRGAWSMGMLVRLRREANLPSTVIRRIDGVLLRTPGGLTPNASTFRAGSVAALRTMAKEMSREPVSPGARAAWGVWPDAVRAAAGGDETLADSLILNAIEGLLRRRRGTAALLDEIAAELVAELNWRPDGSARVWMLRAFDDRTLGPDELHVLTLALATRSKAQGVDHSMVLPRSSSEYSRRKMRDRFGELWGIEARGDQGETISAFARSARETLDLVPREDGRGEAEILAAIVRVARLNTAGSLLWRAETTAASDLMSSLDAPIAAVLDSGSAGDASSLFEAGMGTWAEAYLEAGTHIPRRVELLDKLAGRRDRLGPMEAEVLVIEALRGSPQRVRNAAADVLERFSDQPTVVNAVLESLPMMPRTDRNARIVEVAAAVSLPRVEDAGWPVAARRSLVERLLELIAGHGIYAKLDAIASLLDETYDDRLHGSVAPGTSRAPAMARLSARALAQRWSATAARRPPAGLVGFGVDEIEHRRAARLAMADGLVQAFHVEQLALAELMAQVVAAEQPGLVPRVETLLTAHRLSRERARDVLVQIEHTERLILSLWVLRYGEERG